jgi:hypothetical protein
MATWKTTDNCFCLRWCIIKGGRIVREWDVAFWNKYELQMLYFWSHKWKGRNLKVFENKGQRRMAAPGKGQE